MNAGRLDPPPAAETDSHARRRVRGLASTCLGATVAVVIAGWVGSSSFVLVATGLAGGSFGALLSIAVGGDGRADRDPSRSDPPWFHRTAAAGALGTAAAIVLCWGAVLEATIPGYGAATTAGLLSYALLATTLPRL